MQLVVDAIDLGQQTLKIDCAAGAGAGYDEFHESSGWWLD
jgi:hypothetical protein